MNLDKAIRANEANRILQAISNHGHRFFRSERHNRTTRFEIDGRGRIWLIDKTSGKRIYTHYPYDWRGFTDGGTLKSLCEHLRNYIREGQPISRRWFETTYDDGSHLWGKSEDDMKNLQQEVFRSAAVQGVRNSPSHQTA